MNYFVLIKESKLSNFYTNNPVTFYLVNILYNSCRLSKMKQKFSNFGLKLRYLGIFRLIYEKKKAIAIFEATLNFSKHIVLCKIKNINFWDQKYFIWLFLGWSLKMLCHV